MVKLYVKTVMLALLAAVLVVVPVGCTQAQVNSVLNKIASEIPTAITLADTVGTAVAALDPGVASEVTAGLQIVNAGLPELQTLITSYTANPSGSVLAQIENLINSVVSSSNQTLFAAAHIENSATQKNVTIALSSLSAVLVVIDGFIQQIESAQVVKANAASRQVKLSMIEHDLNHAILDQQAAAAGLTWNGFFQAETAKGY